MVSGRQQNRDRVAGHPWGKDKHHGHSVLVPHGAHGQPLFIALHIGETQRIVQRQRFLSVHVGRFTFRYGKYQ